MFAYHNRITEVEAGRFYKTFQHLKRFIEIRTVMTCRSAISNIQRHAELPSSPTGTLPIVGRQGRHVAHENRIQSTYIHSHLQRRGTDESVDPFAVTFEGNFYPLPFRAGNLRGVLTGSQHRELLIQQ